MRCRLPRTRSVVVHWMAIAAPSNGAVRDGNALVASHHGVITLYSLSLLLSLLIRQQYLNGNEKLMRRGMVITVALITTVIMIMIITLITIKKIKMVIIIIIIKKK